MHCDNRRRLIRVFEKPYSSTSKRTELGHSKLVCKAVHEPPSVALAYLSSWRWQSRGWSTPTTGRARAGPNSDSICRETGLLQSWPQQGPKMLWTAKDLGTGFGTPSIAAGMIFGAGDREGKDGAWALKESDGSPIWFTAIADFKKVGGQNNGPCSTPTYHAGRITSSP